MNLIDDKISEICERKGFTSFWEIFDYMKLAGYDETEALMIASGLFYGDIWGRVINTAKINKSSNEGIFATGATYNLNSLFGSSTSTSDLNYAVMEADLIQPDKDDLMVEIFLITSKGNPVHMPIYRAYVETRKYKVVDELEEHIKSLKINLTSEIAIKIFNDGFAKYK